MRGGKRTKTLNELTLKDDFLFAAVMVDVDHCKDFLERVLEIPIDTVLIDAGKSMLYHPEYRGVRAQVYTKEPTQRHFLVEMQIGKQSLWKRARYYHSRMDMSMLQTGQDYEKLSDCYVIFICDFDPFGFGKYRYTVMETLAEVTGYDYLDGGGTIFLNTKGRNDEEVSRELATFLNFAGAAYEAAEADYGDQFVGRLQDSIRRIKQDKSMSDRYLLLEEWMEDQYKAGRAAGQAEDILLLLSQLGTPSEELLQILQQDRNATARNKVLLTAAKAKTLEQFMREIRLLF